MKIPDASALHRLNAGSTPQIPTLEDGSYLSHHVLGQASGVRALHDQAEVRAACTSMVDQARRSVKIFSSDLEPVIYDTAEFLERARRFALSGRHASLRVIVQDQEPAIKRGHRLLYLAHGLPSFVQIRHAHEDFRDQGQLFLLVDGAGYVRRPSSSAWAAEANFADRSQTARLERFFDHVWELSLVTPDLRRLDL